MTAKDNGFDEALLEYISVLGARNIKAKESSHDGLMRVNCCCFCIWNYLHDGWPPCCCNTMCVQPLVANKPQYMLLGSWLPTIYSQQIAAFFVLHGTSLVSLHHLSFYLVFNERTTHYHTRPRFFLCVFGFTHFVFLFCFHVGIYFAASSRFKTVSCYGSARGNCFFVCAILLINISS